MPAFANPFVDYLNSLRTQDGETNPNYVEENRADYLAPIRAEHSWFPDESDLRVQTRISELVEAMKAPGFPLSLVLLTGDAGDGKTAACMDLAGACGMTRPLAPIDHVGVWTIIKDASENLEEELLAAIEAGRRDGGRVLVAINEGRLRRLGRAAQFAEVWGSVIEPALAAWIDDARAQSLDAAMRTHGVGVVNFRHRMHIRTVTPALLESWSRPAYWEEGPCATCTARAGCPILANAGSLRGKNAVTRVTDTLTMAHFAGQRLPFRRLQGVLAFIMTGGLGCDAILAGRAPQLADRYYSLLFQREPRGRARPEPVASVLAPADAGLSVDASVDRRIVGWMTDASKLPAFERAALAHGDARTTVDALRAMRRYDALANSGSEGASWRRALVLLENYATSDVEKPLLDAVVRALNLLHRPSAAPVATLTDQQIEPGAFRDPARASLELSLGTRFAVALTKGPVLPELVRTWLESSSADIELLAWPEHAVRPEKPARMRLDARLVSILLDVDAGFVFIPALGTYRRELARFHAHLLSMVDPSKTAVTLRSGGQSWRLGAVGDRIRFDGQG